MGTRLDEITYMSLRDFVENEILDTEDRATISAELLRLEALHPGFAKESRRHRRLMREIALHNADADLSPMRPSWLGIRRGQRMYPSA